MGLRLPKGATINLTTLKEEFRKLQEIARELERLADRLSASRSFIISEALQLSFVIERLESEQQ